MASADVVGRCLAESSSSNGQYLKAPSPFELCESQDSPTFDFEFDVESFESHILAESSNTLQPCTDAELETSPHVMLTSDAD